MHLPVLDGFMWMLMNPNSDTHTGAASMLPTKPSPQSSKVKFISLKFTGGGESHHYDSSVLSVPWEGHENRKI